MSTSSVPPEHCSRSYSIPFNEIVLKKQFISTYHYLQIFRVDSGGTNPDE